jgi:putative ATP-dependent endonuclease of OLD family
VYLSKIEVEGYRASAASPVVCELPGRFSLLLGANGSGKTTINEAVLHAHPQRFPRPSPIDAGVLGPPPRAVRVEYSYETDPNDEGALGLALQGSGFAAPSWGRPLERSLGKVRAGSILDVAGRPDNIRLIYLPALRNPVDELSRRDTQVLLELLRAEQLRSPAGGGLPALRARAEAMLASLTAHELVVNIEGRIEEQLKTLSGGLREHHAFIGTQRVDDAYLARVFEMLLATLPNRGEARRLEASSLGYVNLLHIAVTLAGIPDPSAAFPSGGTGGTPEIEERADPEQVDVDGARRRLREVADTAEGDQDSFFPELFHATVLIEEPEAHLHPQMQYGLVRYLRRVVESRPDLQVIVTTHSGEMVAATDPSEIVVLRRGAGGAPIARSLRQLPISASKRDQQFQLTRLHLDASRSAALFADRVLVVEGVTEASLLRVLGRAWAKDDSRKLGFIDALAVVPVGHKVGQWPIRLLATPDFELVGRVAALADTDLRGTPLPPPSPPRWHSDLSANAARFFWSRPTLEPSLAPGNEALVDEALATISLAHTTPVSAGSIDDLFQGTGKPKKGEFAIALAAAMAKRLSDVVVPEHISDLFDWLYEPDSAPTATVASPADTGDA